MRLVAAALALCLTACSFLFVRGPGGGPREYPNCADNAGPPAGDALVAAATGGLAIAHRRSKADDFEDEQPFYILAGAAALYGASFIYGVIQARRCHNARARTPDLGPYRGVPPRTSPPGAPR